MAITHELNESKVVASQVQYLRADRKTREEQYLTALHSVRDQRDAVSDLSECPTRIGDLGDYLTRTRSVYGRERLAGLRTDYAADLERRRIAHFRKSYARDHLVEPPVVTVPKEIPPRSLTRTVTLVRYVLPLLQREDQVSFARPDQSREEKFTDYYWRVHAKGENRVEPDRLYVGSERQAEARSIHRRAIKRLFRQVSAQRHEMASLDFAPFYLDVQGGRPVAKLILASEDVARGLKQGLTLSGLLTPHLPDWYTWRNRGPNVHAIVSFKPGCLLTDDQMAQLAKRYLAALGIEIARHRFAVIRHEDARNPHIHFVWSRVRDDGAFISHPAMTRDRVLHLVAGVQDCVVLGKTFRDALGGMSRPCLIGDTLLDRGGSIAWLQLPCGKKNAIPLQGPVAARRIAAVGFLFDECVGGLPKVIGYWGGNSIHSSGRLLDEYLVRE